MGRSEMLRVSEASAAYRLIGECRDLGSDPAAWYPRMLEGVARFVGALAATGGEGLAPGPRRPVTPMSSFDSGFDSDDREVLASYMREGGHAADPFFRGLELAIGRSVTRRRREVVSDAFYYRSSVYDRYFRPGNIEQRLISSFQAEGAASFSLIHLHRPRGERDFSAREQRLVSFFHQELGPLVGRALVSVAEPTPDKLPSRLRQTLAYLLEGDSEKQVAARLGLATTTAHQYVTALYRRFGVRSRAQLMAYALRRAGRGAWRRGGLSSI